MKKLILPTKGLPGDLVGDVQVSWAAPAQATADGARGFVWGPGHSPGARDRFSVEEMLFSPTLYPLQATVSLGLEVLTPDVFKSQSGISSDLAVAAYNLTKLQEDALAVAHIARAVDAVKGILPF